MRFRKLFPSALFAVAFLFSCGGGASAEDVATLLRLVPPSANTLAVVRVGEIMETPRAKREGWKGETLKFLAGADTVPAWVDALVVGAQFHPGDKDRWVASLLSCPQGVSVEALAKSENRTLQQLGGATAMHTHRDAYYLQLKPDVLGVMSPALRQEASRWARSAAAATKPALSDFLSRAALSNSHLVMAIDLQDMLDPQMIHHRLESTPSLKDKAPVVAALDKLFAGLKGVALFANVGDETHARIDLIFSESLPPEAERLPALLFEMLADQRMMLEEFREGKVGVKGAVLSIDAKLSDAGLRRVLSMILSPYPTSPTTSGAVALDASGRPQAAAAPPADDASQQERDAYVRANRKYYIGIAQTLQDLRDMKGWAKNYSQVAGWIENYAQKIDNQPQVGIDKELIDYGADVSSKLRALASTTRGMVVEVKAAQATLTYRTDVNAMPVGGGWGGGYGWGGGWGWMPHWSVTSNLEQVRTAQAQSVSNNSKQVEELRKYLEDLEAAVRRRMEQKYGVNFVKWML